MSVRAYLSNIAPAWPIKRQESLLAEHVPGWPSVPTYRDEMKPRQRQAHSPATLTERGQMLRPTSLNGREGETIYVASLAVLAWGKTDFLSVLESAEVRQATIIGLSTLTTLPPGADRDSALQAFAAGKLSADLEGARKKGAAISAERRNAASKAASEKIKARWELPPEIGGRTADLIAETGFTRNTVQRWIGKRPAAQARHERNLKRKQQREQA